MNEKSVGLKSNMEKVDAHVITPEEYDEIPELPPEFFTEGTLYRNGKPVRRRGQQQASSKIPVTIRLDPEVVGFFQSKGKDWQIRIGNALQEWIVTHAHAGEK